VVAALPGIPTPFLLLLKRFCLFIGFAESGVPLGVTFSFLIASPLISEIAFGHALRIVRLADRRDLHCLGARHRMSVIGLSLPEMIILRKVIKIKLILIFAGILFVSFTLTGYLFNAIRG
jgi:uncharacterized membrane protein YraQ (UPF0718 family)